MDRTNITEQRVAGFLVGWTYYADGAWYATAANEGRTTYGPLDNVAQAADALVQSVYLMQHVREDGEYLLMVARDDAAMSAPGGISGTVTWFTADKMDGEAVRWQVRDGQVDINGWSGVGSIRNAEAKAAAMLEAATEAHTANAAQQAVAA
jgi:hypothetical protein